MTPTDDDLTTLLTERLRAAPPAAPETVTWGPGTRSRTARRAPRRRAAWVSAGVAVAALAVAASVVATRGPGSPPEGPTAGPDVRALTVALYPGYPDFVGDRAGVGTGPLRALAGFAVWDPATDLLRAVTVDTCGVEVRGAADGDDVVLTRSPPRGVKPSCTPASRPLTATVGGLTREPASVTVRWPGGRAADALDVLSLAEATRDATESLPVGTTGTLSLFLHCGLQYATIEGTTWETDRRYDDPSAGFSVSLFGAATRTAADEVTFRGFDTAHTEAVFRPSDATPACY